MSSLSAKTPKTPKTSNTLKASVAPVHCASDIEAVENRPPLGADTVAYGLLLGLNALALVVVSALSSRLTATRSVESVLTLGIALVTTSTIAFALLVFFGAPAFWLTVPLFTAVGSLGLVFGNATALALGAVPQIAGSASAVLGALQFGLATLVSPLVSLGGEGTAAPLALVMVAAAAIAVVALAVTRRAEGGEDAQRHGAMTP